MMSIFILKNHEHIQRHSKKKKHTSQNDNINNNTTLTKTKLHEQNNTLPRNADAYLCNVSSQLGVTMAAA